MKRRNSYDAIRLLAAILVIFSHSFALTGRPEPGAGLISIGAISVWVFFILSGYLISASWDQYPRFNVFFAKRALRIFPGLIVAIFLTIAVCGLFFTTIPLKEFLFSQETWTYINNIFLYNNSFTLPGVFTHNIYPHAVNGSIWTLSYEFTMYLTVATIGAFRLYKKVPPIYFWFFLFITVLIISTIGKEYFALSIFYLTVSQLFIFALVFFSGVMMYKYEDIIKLDYVAGLTSLVTFVILSIKIPEFTAVFGATFLAYATFSLGRSSILSKSSRFGDFSYGLYIYAFPIQQMIAATTHTLNPYKMFALSLTITFIVSVFSWHIVESKALALKSKINPHRYPLSKEDGIW